MINEEQEVCNNCGKTLREQMKGCGEITCYRQFLSKQETLDEVALRLYPIILEDDGWDKNKQYRNEWIKGVKWQQERMYSEEEVLDMMFEVLNQKREECCITYTRDSIVRKVFEQFKKK